MYSCIHLHQTLANTSTILKQTSRPWAVSLSWQKIGGQISGRIASLWTYNLCHHGKHTQSHRLLIGYSISTARGSINLANHIGCSKKKDAQGGPFRSFLLLSPPLPPFPFSLLLSSPLSSPSLSYIPPLSLEVPNIPARGSGGAL